MILVVLSNLLYDAKKLHLLINCTTILLVPTLTLFFFNLYSGIIAFNTYVRITLLTLEHHVYCCSYLYI